MAGQQQQQTKRGSPMENGAHTRSKKARAPQAAALAPLVEVKEERLAVFHAGGGGDQGAGAPLQPLQVALPERPPITVSMEAWALHCPACCLPLKPPAFKCDAGGHAVCSGCKASGELCSGCGRATTYTRFADLDAYLAAAKVPCPYGALYGCESSVAYYAVADHLGECPCAPCSCPETGCGFSSSPGKLLNHFTGVHHWPPADELPYGKPFNVSLLTTRRWHALVGEEDRSVFLLSLCAAGAATEIALVCVRANGAAPAAPKFKCSIRVNSPFNGVMLPSAMVSFTVESSTLDDGRLAPAEQPVFLTVPRALVHPKSGKVQLIVRIHKLRDATPTPPVAAAASANRSAPS